MLSHTLCTLYGKKTHCNSLGELEDVKDELFHFNPIWFVWFDQLPLLIHIWDLLLGHVVLQLWLVLPDINRKKSKKDACSLLYLLYIDVELLLTDEEILTEKSTNCMKA